MKTFKSQRHHVSCLQTINAGPKEIFPLLCPKREYDWIPGWECEINYSVSGYAELNCVFTTNFPENGKEVWIVDRYVPDSLIQFIVTSDKKIMRYTISLTEKNNGSTILRWEQTITTLNEEGNQHIQKLTQEVFAKKIKHLEYLLNYYFTNGEMPRQ